MNQVTTHLVLLLIALFSSVRANIWVDAIGGNDNNDGLTESTAIQSIAKLVTLLQVGDTAYFKDGVYSDEFALPGNINPNGWDYGVNITAAPGATPIWTTANSSSIIIDLTLVKYITFSGITFDQPSYQMDSGIDALMNIYASYIVFDNCTFIGHNDNDVNALLFTDASYWVVQNCRFENWKGNNNLYDGWLFAGNCIYPDDISYLTTAYTVGGLAIDAVAGLFIYDNAAEIPQFVDPSDPFCSGLVPDSPCDATTVPITYTLASATSSTVLNVTNSDPFFAGNYFVAGDQIQIEGTTVTVVGKTAGALFLDTPVTYNSNSPVYLVDSKPPFCSYQNDSSSEPAGRPILLIAIIVAGAVAIIAGVIIAAVLVTRAKRRKNQGAATAYEDPAAINMQSVGASRPATVNASETVIPGKDIEVLEPLGEGRFGAVYKGLFNKTSLVALKTLKREDKGSNFAREAELLSKLRHPNIVQFHGIWISPKKEEFMVFEFVNRGSLLDLLPKLQGSADSKSMLKMALQIASGMSYLESMNIVHRDLAARNILVKEDDYGYVLKISDFGLSREVSANQFYTAKDGEIPVKWTSPEALAYNKYSSKSDVWSFGIVVWEMFEFGKVPYPKFTNAVTRQKVMEGYRMEKPEACPDNVHTLLLQCWDEKPNNRPSFSDLQQTISSWIDSKEGHMQVPALPSTKNTNSALYNNNTNSYMNVN